MRWELLRRRCGKNEQVGLEQGRGQLHRRSNRPNQGESTAGEAADPFPGSVGLRLAVAYLNLVLDIMILNKYIDDRVPIRANSSFRGNKTKISGALFGRPSIS